MSWKTSLLGFVKRHGEVGKFAAKTVLGAVLPGSPVVVDLVGKALDCAVDTGKDQWDIANEPAMSDADAARLAEVLDMLQGNLAALIPTLTPLQSVPDIAKQVLAAQMVADETLAGLAVEIQQSAEQFDAFAEQQRQILENQRFAGDALVEMLDIMRPMAGMGDFFRDLKASGIGGHEIASAVAVFRAGQVALASGNVTSARENFATFAAAHESMPVAQIALASAQAAGHEMQAAQQTIERATKIAPTNRRLTELHHRVTRLSKATPPAPGIITSPLGSPIAKPPGIGDLVDGWRLDALLGHGGMGQVFRAEKAGQWRALKIMQPALSTDMAMAERFKREIMALAALPIHPHLVRIETFGFCPAFGCWYLVMEFVEGQSLETHLQTTASLPVPAAVTTIAKIADGLAAAHARGILHRDIKPENIILRHRDREPVLVDFGLAGIEAAPNLTATGRAAGYTLMFASPEQLSHHAVTAASDVWSLAATLLYAVNFGDAEARQARLADADDYPAELREVLTTALASRPARRFASAAAFRDALRGPIQTPASAAKVNAHPAPVNPAPPPPTPSSTVIEIELPPREFHAIVGQTLDASVAAVNREFGTNFRWQDVFYEVARVESEEPPDTVLAEDAAGEITGSKVTRRCQVRVAIEPAVWPFEISTKQIGLVTPEQIATWLQKNRGVRADEAKRAVEVVEHRHHASHARGTISEQLAPGEGKGTRIHKPLRAIVSAGAKPTLIECTVCGKRLEIPPAHFGKKIRCPGCQSVLVIDDRGTLEKAIPAAPPKPKFREVPGYTFLGEQEFSCPNDVEGEKRFTLPVYRCDAFVQALMKAGKLNQEPTEIFVPGQKRNAAVDCEFVLLPPPGHDGRFVMGDKNDSPNETMAMQIAKPFLIARTAVTQRVYLAIGGKHDAFDWPGDMQPANEVSWNDICGAEGFIARARLTGLRLPSEAEWEFACRAGTQTPFCFGSGKTVTSEIVNFDGNYPYGDGAKSKYRQRTVEVGSLAMNAFGLFEVHGNVWEWCGDAWVDTLAGIPTEGTARENSGASNRVVRGGGWNSNAVGCRSAYRFRYEPGRRILDLGFRPVQALSD